MTKDEALRLALEALGSNRRTHHYCEDTWYSCPKHEDGCANDSEGDECNCGADKANAGIDKAITAIKEALANEALDKMAENARELGLDYYVPCCTDQTCPKCKAALEAKDEPAAWLVEEYGDSILVRHSKNFPGIFAGDEFRKRPLFYGDTTPPQRKPLTDEERRNIAQKWRDGNGTASEIIDMVEAAHGIKGRP